jgi:hypothetical protein
LLASEYVAVSQATTGDGTSNGEVNRERWVEFDAVRDPVGRYADYSANRIAR